jgi:UDPglucose 6-dehydrogenase
MKVTVVGTGYVGLVSGACLAEVGHDVLCMDVDEAKVAMLQAGKVPIYEAGLADMVGRNVAADRLAFTSDEARAVAHGAIQMIAVGTPEDEDGSADDRHVLAAARTIGRLMAEPLVVVCKSTVPVGTADKVREAIRAELAARDAALHFAVVSNPEFLKEGAAVEDFMKPSRIIVGGEDAAAIEMLRALYVPFTSHPDQFVVMDTRSSELTKYAANAMLATRISFMNELALLAEKLGADIDRVRHGIGSDPRVGYEFLRAGCGYGGSCFPKDVNALIHTAGEIGQPLRVLNAVKEANEAQKQVLARRVVEAFGDDLSGRTFALWGLAFKPDTHDMREASSQVVIGELAKRGAKIVAYDPVATAESRRLFAGEPRLTYAKSPMAALDGADALVIVTEWAVFRNPDFAQMKRLLKTPLIIDGRNLYEPAVVRGHGFRYVAIGRL